MPTGTVAFYHDKDGYGFIETDAADDDVFFHISDVPGSDDPSEGDEFEFIIQEDDEGLRATAISKA